MKAETKLLNAEAEVKLWEVKLKESYSPFKYREFQKAKVKLEKLKIKMNGIQTKLV